MELKGRIVVYSIVGCPHCVRAKATLEEMDLPYTEICLDAFPQLREEVKKRTGQNTVPQIFFNAIHIGGNSDLQELVKDREKFAKLVEEVKKNPPPKDAPEIPGPEECGSGSSDYEVFICEPDEYSALVRELKASGLIGDHKKGLVTMEKSFRGRDFVDWVVKTQQKSRYEAVSLGQSLLDKHFGHDISRDQEFTDSDELYRLLEDDDSNALNVAHISACELLPAAKMAELLRQGILKVYQKYVSADGKQVDYKGLGQSPEFHDYIKLTEQLQRIRVEDMNREESISFFINVYNALVIHGNVARGPHTSLWQRYKFFNTVAYMIGGYRYSLQDIQNGVLRANRKGIGQLFAPFSKTDPRWPVALKIIEPLSHFGLAYGCKSAPPVRTYSSSHTYKELREACEAFLESEDGCTVDVDMATVSLSYIFRWYQEDFGSSTAEVESWVTKHMYNGKKKRQLEEVLKAKHKLIYLPFDWTRNE